jgi:hypothetical protein
MGRARERQAKTHRARERHMAPLRREHVAHLEEMTSHHGGLHRAATAADARAPEGMVLLVRGTPDEASPSPIRGQEPAGANMARAQQRAHQHPTSPALAIALERLPSQRASGQAVGHMARVV